MKYAIFQTGGKQYKAVEGTELLVEKLPVEPQEDYIFDEVLLIVDEDNRTVGNPFIAGAQVEAEALDQTKGVKIRVAIYKAKSRYRKVKGHRQSLTRVKIARIVTREKSEIKAKPKAVKASKKQINKK